MSRPVIAQVVMSLESDDVGKSWSPKMNYLMPLILQSPQLSAELAVLHLFNI
jgi:hypothetical protein